MRVENLAAFLICAVIQSGCGDQARDLVPKDAAVTATAPIDAGKAKAAQATLAKSEKPAETSSAAEEPAKTDDNGPKGPIEDAIVFPSLPVVDDSEATLRAKGIEDLKDQMAILSESVGTESPDGGIHPFLETGTVIPVQFNLEISTLEDGQREMKITFVRSKGQAGTKNRVIGTVRILGLPNAAAGTPKIDLQRNMQRNGDLVVSARDKSNGKPMRLQRVGE
jgi:hypothetical protein